MRIKRNGKARSKRKRAMKKLTKKLSQVDMSDPKFRAQLQAALEKEGLADKVKFD